MHFFAFVLSCFFCALVFITHDPWFILHQVYFGVLGSIGMFFTLLGRIKERTQRHQQTWKDV